MDPKCVVKSLNLDKKIECNANSPTFITVKDYMDNLKRKLPCSLIDQAKGEMGIAAKLYRESINVNIPL